MAATFCYVLSGQLCGVHVALPHTTFVQSQPATEKLSHQLLRWSFFNLLVVACLGVLLRALPLINGFPLLYKNVLHGHSHFAFGGWVMPVLLALLLKSFPTLANAVTYKHWHRIATLLIASAYGMLVAFPLQGYKAVAIFFSTLSLVAGFYLTIVVWKAVKRLPQTTPYLFLKWGLAYGALASVGPLATGPIIALGMQGTPLYRNAIYFYLHFTYNGFFVFGVLALLYQNIMNLHKAKHGQQVFALLHAACVPAFALSLLWNNPPLVVNGLGGAAALLQLAALRWLLLDASGCLWASKNIRWLFRLSLVAFALKLLLQALSAVPAIAALAAQNRNFVIAYLHLVLIGFVSLFAIAQAVHVFGLSMHKKFKNGLYLFLAAFICTELLLVVNGFHRAQSFYLQGMLVLSILFLPGAALLFGAVNKQATPQWLHDFSKAV